MTHQIRRLSQAMLGLVFIILAVFAVSAQDKDWRPVTPAELASKPVVDPAADAEALFWEVRVDDSSTDGLTLKHYVRVKIFTEKGRDQFAKREIVYAKGTKIKDLVARVTKPDGTVVDLDKSDVHETEVVKANGIKILSKTFAAPGLDIGSIIEYRYREVIDNGEANMRLIFQRDIPIQTISYYVKPFSGRYAMRYQAFHMGQTKFEKDKDGFSRATMTNVPAFKEEPDMLPENEVRAWMYIYYTGDESKTVNEYWGKISAIFYEESKNMFKPNDEVKAAAQKAVEGATTDDEKLHRLYDLVKSEIKNTSYADNVTEDEKKHTAKNAGDVLKQHYGRASDIDILFGAMARSLGFDVRLALSGDRSEQFFNPNVPSVGLMLNSTSVAVKVGSDWRFFSPASYFTPYGMLSWVEEGQTALITDPKEVIWKATPISAADRSLEKRSGTFKLMPGGSMEGEARIEDSGHIAAARKERARKQSSADQEKDLDQLIRQNILGTAEIQGVSIENLKDPEKPVVYKFKIRVPGYASKTGKRIFFQPDVFERSSKPRFISNERTGEVYFDYPYAEHDELTIDMPSGFQLESAETPGPVSDPNGIGKHNVSISIDKGANQLIYKRDFSWGNGGNLRFPVQSYPAVKQMFEMFNTAAVHQLTLKQSTN